MELWIYVCDTPNCTAFHPAYTKEPQSVQRCHACGKQRRKLTLYAAGPKHKRPVPAKAFGGSE